MEEGGMNGNQVWTGRHVQLELRYENGDTETLALDIVSDNAADFDNGFLGEGTPLARAIMGKTAGAAVAYHAGDIVQARILSVSTELSSEPKDLSERREETTRKALLDADKISTVIYASAMSNKWGDMDPKHLSDDEDEEEQQKK